jgi:hypothetical protein
VTHPSPGASRHPLPGGERDCFGDCAERLCGAASLLLGWRPDEFWSATPAELATALKAPDCEAPDQATIEELRARFPDE